MIFPYINRGKPLTVIWVPGWATLPGLYESVCRHANSLICHPLDPNTFDATLTHSLKKHNIQTATIVGFSLGCFLSASYAKNNPEQIFRTVLIGMRPAYDAAQIRHIQASLTENKKGYLSAFFKSSFHETSEFRTFLTQHFKPTLKHYSLAALNEGLDFLASAQLNAADLHALKSVSFCHGAFDKIAPIAEVENWVRDHNLNPIKRVQTGHIPFFNGDAVATLLALIQQAPEPATTLPSL